MFELFPVGARIIGHATVTADDPPVEVAIAVPSNIRQVWLVCYNDSQNLVFGATADDDGPTAVEIPNNVNGVSQTIGPLAVESLPYHLFSDAPTVVNVTMVGSSEGETDTFKAS